MPTNTEDASSAVGFRLADFLPYRLAVATEQVIRVFGEDLEVQFNLTISEWRVLAVVAEYGTLSPTLVGQRTGMDKVKVSRAAQSLVAKGLLRQSQDPRDGRGRLLRLTRKGTTTHANAVPAVGALEQEVFKPLTRADLAAFSRILSKISTHLETSDEGDATDGE